MAYERVARLADLDEERPLQVKVGDLPVALVRSGDRVHAVLDVCSHEDYPLHEGFVFGGQIECALHGSMFDLASGAPESLPATVAVPVFAAKVDDGDVLVDVEQKLNDAPIPDHA